MSEEFSDYYARTLGQDIAIGPDSHNDIVASVFRKSDSTANDLSGHAQEALLQPPAREWNKNKVANNPWRVATDDAEKIATLYAVDETIKEIRKMMDILSIDIYILNSIEGRLQCVGSSAESRIDHIPLSNETAQRSILAQMFHVKDLREIGTSKIALGTSRRTIFLPHVEGVRSAAYLLLSDRPDSVFGVLSLEHTDSDFFKEHNLMNLARFAHGLSQHKDRLTHLVGAREIGSLLEEGK